MAYLKARDPNGITTIEAMQISGLSRQWIYTLITAGKVESTRIANIHLVHRDSLLKYMHSNGSDRRRKKKE